MSSTCVRPTSVKEPPHRLACRAARDLYRRCVELDPGYAPAWARLGRVYRVLAKYGHGNIEEDRRAAEEAFRKALELNPDLPLAHSLYTYFEIEEFGAACEAMVRLLRLASTRAADPDLYAGLVVACRFCGLLDASLAADRRARRIDPGVRTSVHYTYWMLGDYEQTVLTDLEEIQTLRHAALWMMGRQEEALQGIRSMESHWQTSERWYITALRSAMEGDRDGCVEGTRQVLATGFHDPEGLLFCARSLARVQASDFALSLLDQVVDGGFSCSRSLVHDPWFDSLRAEPRFIRILHRAEAKTADAADAVCQGGRRASSRRDQLTTHAVMRLIERGTILVALLICSAAAPLARAAGAGDDADPDRIRPRRQRARAASRSRIS